MIPEHSSTKLAGHNRCVKIGNLVRRETGASMSVRENGSEEQTAVAVTIKQYLPGFARVFSYLAHQKNPDCHHLTPDALTHNKASTRITQPALYKRQPNI